MLLIWVSQLIIEKNVPVWVWSYHWFGASNSKTLTWHDMMRQNKWRPKSSVKMAQDFIDICDFWIKKLNANAFSFYYCPLKNRTIIHLIRNWQYFIHVEICMKIRRINYDMTDVVEAKNIRVCVCVCQS